MKKLVWILSCLLVSPVFAENAIPFCIQMSTSIHVKTRPGNTKYVTQYSKEAFLRQAETPFSPHTLGLTVAKLDVHVETKPQLTQQWGQICVALSDVTVDMHYPSLVVYIDKKYPPSSCAYQVVKEHEDYHVAVAQEALSFFKDDVEKNVAKTVMQLAPKIVYTRTEIPSVVHKFNNAITKALRPLVEHINKKLIEKNQAIDTPEMYKETTAMCKDW